MVPKRTNWSCERARVRVYCVHVWMYGWVCARARARTAWHKERESFFLLTVYLFHVPAVAAAFTEFELHCFVSALKFSATTLRLLQSPPMNIMQLTGRVFSLRYFFIASRLYPHFSFVKACNICKSSICWIKVCVLIGKRFINWFGATTVTF